MRPLLILLSLVPHLYVAGVGMGEDGPSGFLLGLLGWNVLPVLVGTVAAYSRFRRQGVGWLIATLAGSTWAVWAGLLHPRGSTGALIFLFLPAWNLGLLGPVGALLAVGWGRFAARRTSAT
jgi:hypothetical protein